MNAAVQNDPLAAPVWDVRTQLLGAFLLVIALTATTRPIGLLFGLICAVIFWFAGRLTLKAAWRVLRLPLPFLLLLALLQVFILPGGTLLFSWKFISIRSVGVLAAGMLLLRFSALILIINQAAKNLNASQAVRGVDALLRPLGRLGFPVEDVSLVVQVTLNFLPYLQQTANRIAQAQSSRGADWDTPQSGLLERARQVLPFLVPLILLTLRRAETLALAVEVRAFRSGQPRSSRVDLHFRRRDAAALAALTILSLAICLL